MTETNLFERSDVKIHKSVKKKKVKAISVHSMKTRRNGGIAPLILNLGAI